MNDKSSNAIVSYFQSQVKSNEWRVLIWSFLYFFFLLTGYFILRPIREEMGVTAGPENYGWLFLSTFIAMLLIQPIYGKIVSNFSRKQFIPIIYGFFGVAILIIWSLFHLIGTDSVVLARVFFVFVSVYNLFVVSIFWSFMADVFNKEQGKRLFGVIAAGGSSGGIAGSKITESLVHYLGTINLLIVSFLFLMFCIFSVLQVRKYADNSQKNMEAPLGGSAIEGFKLILNSKLLQQIAIMTVTATIIGSIFYYLQGEYIKQYYPLRDDRTELFAKVNRFTNYLTLFFQLILTPFLLQKVKIHKTLGIYPVLMVFAFLLFGLLPVIQVVLGAIILQRSGAYGIMKPPTDWLFTGLDKNIKYKFKNFLDTVIYRGGDVFAQLIFVNTMLLISKDLRIFAVAGVVLSILWLFNAMYVGRLVTKENDQQKEK
jgi:AAA family ATP:ADP antiporter